MPLLNLISRTWKPGASTTIATLVPILALVLWAGDVHAQLAAVCSNTPTTEQRIECTEDTSSTDDIDIDTSGLTITTTGVGEFGIYAVHNGSGNIDINSQSDTITTHPIGIRAKHAGVTGNGDITISTTSSAITTTQNGGHGIQAETVTRGIIDVDVTGSTISTTGMPANGITIFHNYNGTDLAGDVTLDINGGTSITTTSSGIGAFISRLSSGDAIITLENATIDTMGNYGAGARAHLDHNGGVELLGNAEIHLLGGVTIETAGLSAHGVYALQEGRSITEDSDAFIMARGANSITTSGDEAYGIYGTRSYGGRGNVRIDARDIGIRAIVKSCVRQG